MRFKKQGARNKYIILINKKFYMSNVASSPFETQASYSRQENIAEMQCMFIISIIDRVFKII